MGAELSLLLAGDELVVPTRSDSASTVVAKAAMRSHKDCNAPGPPTQALCCTFQS